MEKFHVVIGYRMGQHQYREHLERAEVSTLDGVVTGDPLRGWCLSRELNEKELAFQSPSPRPGFDSQPGEETAKAGPAGGSSLAR